MKFTYTLIAVLTMLGNPLLIPAGGAPKPSEDGPKVIPDKGSGSGELDLSAFPGQVVNDVVVPVPSEIFSVLDKLGDPDWKAQLSRVPIITFNERTDVALLLGATVAEGFIAVQAEDVKTVENIGRDVLNLATALGVREDVIRHCQSISNAATASKWDVVRTELDATQSTVRRRMEDLRDGALAECVSVGGWLRGTEVITSVITRSYSLERADLLSQPDLADYFNDALENMLTTAKNPLKLKVIADGVAHIREIMDTGEQSMTAQGVQEINRISASLVKAINTNK